MTSISSSSSSLDSSTAASTLKMNSFLFKTIPPIRSDLHSVWNKYLRDTTETIAGADLSKAKIICLGDEHDEDWQNNWRGAIIDHYGSDGDIVLCEAYAAKQKIPQSAGRFAAHRKLSCYGWDNRDFFKMHENEIAAMMKLIEKYKEDELSSKWSKEDRDAWQLLCKAEEAFNYMRTRELTKTAKSFAEQLRPGQKMFIIAGSYHLLYKCNEPGLDRFDFNIVDSLKIYKPALLLPIESRVKTFEDGIAYRKKSDGKSK